ncbi:Gfo/Idh/MocA family oxidoreductase [bacterium]|nr:Gfo/Idh/MocA family oxidoreductase [bacterium]
MKKIKVGVIGVGHLGRFHAQNYSKIEQAELIGVYDVDYDRATEIAAETNCQAFKSLDDLLEAVDGVSIVVPTDKHLEAGLKAIEKNVHVLVEKPIAVNTEEADTLINEAQKRDLTLQVGQVERFNPAVRALDQFDLQPKFIESHRLAPFNPRGTEVAVVLDLMIHDIDFILHMVKSPVAKVDASGVAVVSDTIDIANARLTFENGAVANLTASRISQKKMRKMRLFQKDAYVTVDFLDKVAEIFQLEEDASDATMILGEMGIGDRKKQIGYHRPKISDVFGLEVELEAFVLTLAGQTVATVSGQEGRDALAVAMQVMKQMEGQAI